MIIQRLRPYFSGQGVQVESLCRRLAARGHDVTVVTAFRGGRVPVERTAGYRVHRLRCDLPGIRSSGQYPRIWGPIFALRALWWLWRRRRTIDIIHVHAMTDALHPARWLGQRLGIPVVFEMTLLGSDDPGAVASSTNLLSGARFRSYAACDGFVAISPALADAYRESGLPPDRLRLIPQGVDTERFRPPSDRSEARRRLGDLPADGPLAVFVGSLIERKGIDVLLAAWNRVHAARPGARLALVGRRRFDDPAAEDFLTGRLQELGPAARDRLHLLGLRDDPETVLRAADLFVFPTRREGFGTAMIEAMACGLPCVVSELPGITEFVFDEDGVDGRRVPVGDASALADAVVDLLDDPERARSMGERARRRVVERFGLDTIADRYVEMYTDLLERDGR